MSRLLAVLAWLCWATLAIADPLVPGSPPTSCTIASCNIGVAMGTSLALGSSIGSDVFEVTGTSTHNGNLTVAGASLILSGNQSVAAWTTNGVRLKGVSATMTDTTSSGTVAAAYTDVLGGNTIAASSATTYTKYAALRVNAPVAGTNVTFTNAPALDVASETIGGATLGTNVLAVTGGVLLTPPTISNIASINIAGTSTATVGTGINIDATAAAGGQVFDFVSTANGSGSGAGWFLVGGGSGNMFAASYTQLAFVIPANFKFGFTNGTAFTLGTLDTILTRKAPAILQHGAPDASTSVAQTIGFQGIVAGTSNTSGSTATIIGSLSTGSGTSGDIDIRTGGTGAGATVQNASVSAILIKGATQQVRLPQITSDAAQTDATICEDTTNHALFSGSGTLGICLGTSSARYKHDVSDLGLGLHAIMGLQPKRYFLDRQHGDPAKPYYGFLAEDGVGVLPELVGNDNVGRPNTFDYLGIVPILVRAVQEQQAEIEALRRVMR